MSERAVRIAGEGVSLQAVVHLPDSADQPLPGVVVCHPHPQYGGDMDNNVVMALVEALTERGIAALRFNFRGVGGSSGTFDNGRGETRDTEAAVAFLAASVGVDAGRVGLAGYSFGSMTALGAAGAGVSALALVSPPLRGLNPERLAGLALPLLMVTGDRDPVCPAEQFREVVASIAAPVGACIVADADHSWWGHERELGEIAGSFFARQLGGEGVT